VDSLFSSGAGEYGHRVQGVLLSGAGADGVGGLIRIKAAGGICLVQDPREAEQPSMPLRAIHDDHVDAVLPIQAISAAIRALVSGKVIQN